MVSNWVSPFFLCITFLHTLLLKYIYWQTVPGSSETQLNRFKWLEFTFCRCTTNDKMLWFKISHYMRMASFGEAGNNLQGWPHSAQNNLRFQSFRPRNWRSASDHCSCGPAIYVSLLCTQIHVCYVCIKFFKAKGVTIKRV